MQPFSTVAVETGAVHKHNIIHLDTLPGFQYEFSWSVSLTSNIGMYAIVPLHSTGPGFL